MTNTSSLTRVNLAGQPSETSYLSREEKIAWWRLINTENVGPVTFYQLLSRFKNVFEALKRLPRIAHKAGRQNPLRIPTLDEAEWCFDVCEKKGFHLVAFSEPSYPDALRALPDAPPILSVKGDLGLLKTDCFAVVGARTASALGQEVAYNWSQNLADAGMTIVSGLANGIDTSAHKATLLTGTIAVLASGLDKPYPPENMPLYERIAEEGIILSEAPLGTEPHANLFPRRNRLISGLSWGVLVVEAAVKSGSILTAHYALEQGRQVFVVPGHPQDPRSRGGNRLIQEGAILCQEPQDILDVRAQPMTLKEDGKSVLYNLQSTQDKTEGAEEVTQAVRDKICKLLTQTPTSPENIQLLTGLSAPLVKAALVELTLAGRVAHTLLGHIFTPP